MTPPRVLALVLLAGCHGRAHDTAAAPPPDGSVAPAIVTVDRVECIAQPTAGEVWQMDLTVSDPQGAATVAAGAVSVRNRGDGELGAYTLACNGATCVGDFRADYDNVGCALAGTITFVFTVTDADGHVSPPRTHST